MKSKTKVAILIGLLASISVSIVAWAAVVNGPPLILNARFATGGGTNGDVLIGTSATNSVQVYVPSTMNQNGFGVSLTPALTLKNGTASTGGTTAQWSPALVFSGSAWNSSALQSETMLASWDVESATNAGSITPLLVLKVNNNGGGYAKLAQFGASASNTSPFLQFNAASRATIKGSVSNGNSAIAVSLSSANALSTAGASQASIEDGTTGTGRLRLGDVSGAGTGFLSYGEDLTCSGTCTAGEIMCWGGADGATVSQCAATANLTTIAGVALVTVTNATANVARHGRAQVKCDTGTAIGPVGTSGTTAGRVNNTVSAFGALIGHVTKAEATNLCIVNLEL